MSWDEFRLVKAIADTRSLGGAASRLGLNHSTVFRRLAALENAVGAPLFERSRAGYELTAAGEEMTALANVMADSIVEFERRVAGRDVKPTGRLRVTTVEAIGQRFLPAILAQFQAQNPGVVTDLILAEREMNLSQRDADVAIRVTNNPPETLVGRRICTFRWSVYRRRGDEAEAGSAAPALEERPFVGFPDDFGPPFGRRWIEASLRPERIAVRVNSMHVALELAADGFGAALPCFLGDPHPGLSRVGPALDDWDMGLWILTHSDLRRSARVRAFMDLAGAEFTRHRRLIEGTEGD